MRKIYLAGPWFTEKADILEKYAYSMYEATDDVNDCTVFRPRTEGKESPLLTFYGNLDAIDSCDVVVALISEKDVGTAFEIGYARAKKKVIYLVGFDEKDFERKTNLMLAFASDFCITIDKLWKLFTDNLEYEKDLVKFKTGWEDIE
jgi:nucleoside 2-deoxyribosyltransferase